MLTTAIITIIVNRGEVEEGKKEERIVKDSRKKPPALRNVTCPVAAQTK